MEVPFLDLKAQLPQILPEIEVRLKDIIANTGFILGKYVSDFEEAFAQAHDVNFCIGVSSGTDALHVALMSLGIGVGDRVIVPVNTFIATAEALSLTGAAPVFVDCDEYYNINAEKLERLLRQKAEGERPKVKAVMPVHLYGQPANMDAITALAEKHGLAVIEDACQAHLARYNGTRVGNIGKFGAFSFYPGKNLGAFGEAGALVTNDENLYQKARMIRQHGEIERYHHRVIGHNYRMEAIQGAVLGVKLKYLDEWTRRRRANAHFYNRFLAEVPGIETPPELDGTECVYHLYVIQADDRSGLQKHLAEQGIATGLHYPVPLHLQEAYRHLGYKRGDFPVAERAAARILSLPMYPELTEAQIRYVCEQIAEYMKRSI
ncbi:MAG: DegT/DnrJ/EryC1/StrS family aminotransferase [Desulfobacterales bacterium]